DNSIGGFQIFSYSAHYKVLTLIIAFVVFLMVKGINKVLRQDKKEEAPAPKDPQLEVLEEIRDSLKKLDK
ncbi:MscL family protein, partial [Ligilactobacillus salivarius]|uniref:MscL family protein n=1 Tax=Ligilactobacillus salivarius TaxID=1624 RepID=UPI001CDC0EEE